MQSPAITLEQADALLKRDIEKFSYIVNRDCYNLNQNQFDALVSFCYNLGSVSGIKDKVNNKTLTREDLTAYSYAKGKFLQGLFNRRNIEADLYFKAESIVTLIKRRINTSTFTKQENLPNEDKRSILYLQ